MAEVAPPAGLWIVFTLIAAAAQTARNATQKELIRTLGTLGATYVRFIYALPFAVLSLAAMVAVVGRPLPLPGPAFAGWLLVGSLAQIGATALMLAAMRLRSFVVATAYTKTEALQVALFALLFLAEKLSGASLAAIGLATAGVWLLSWPKAGAADEPSWRPAAYGLAAGALFAVSAVGFKGAIVSLGGGLSPAGAAASGGAASAGFLLPATLTLVLGLVTQTVLLALWQAARNPAVLAAVARAWQPSLRAGFAGALASQMWFLAFAIAPTAHVRSLGMVEMLFALAVSRRLFSQHTGGRDLAGIALVVAGSLLLINA